MNGYGIIAALFLAVVLTLIFSGSFRHRGPLGGLLLFFLVIFFASWAGQLWLHPIGPSAFGIAFLPFTSVAVLIAILLVATASGTNRITTEKADNVPAEEPLPFFAIGLFFWLLLLFLLAVIVLGYYIVPGGKIMAT